MVPNGDGKALMAEKKSRRDRTGVTLIYDTGSREDDALSRFQWVMPGVFLASALIFLIAALQWLPPQLPILIFVGLVLVPLTLVLTWRVGGFKPRKLVVAVSLVAVFGLPLLAWNVGLYRGITLWAMGDLISTETLIQAAGDRSEWVASMACERALLQNSSDVDRRIRTVIEYRPALAIRCLTAVQKEEPDVAMSVARYLHHQWYEGWMGAGVMPADVACQAAGAFVELDPMQNTQGAPRLLMCTLGAATPELAQCCGDALRSYGDEETILDVRPELWTEEFQEDLFRLLSSAVDLPAITLMGTEPVSSTLSWTPADLFHWTTNLGCHLMDGHHQANAIASQLSRTIHTQCGLDVEDPLFSFAAILFVRRTCREAVTVGAERRVDVVEWCEAAREAARVTVVEAARFVVENALSAYLVDSLERSITEGDSARRGEAAVAEQHRTEMIDGIRQAREEGAGRERRDRGDELRRLGELRRDE